MMDVVPFDFRVNQNQVKSILNRALSLLPERYEFREVLGQGGQGIVISCKDKKLRKPVAIKTSIHGIQSNLQTEYEVMVAADSCAHLTSVVELTTVDDVEFLVMQHLGNDLLKDVMLQPLKRYSPLRTAHVAIEVLSAVKELHEIGYVHNDIKPSNFAFGLYPDVHGKLYLFDYGLCLRRVDGCPMLPSNRKAYDGRIYGTLEYASITAQMHQTCTVWDDLQCALYTLIELFAGSLPWANIVCPRTVLECKRNLNVDDIVRGKFYPLKRLEEYLRYGDRASIPDYEGIIKYFKDYATQAAVKSDAVWDGIFSEED
uniref:Protein kinase domain-containing protein n=1 Tax=Trichuris muris TaxID=70415 RepID=A0A5S6QAK5_TRIMR